MILWNVKTQSFLSFMGWTCMSKIYDLSYNAYSAAYLLYLIYIRSPLLCYPIVWFFIHWTLKVVFKIYCNKHLLEEPLYEFSYIRACICKSKIWTSNRSIVWFFTHWKLKNKFECSPIEIILDMHMSKQELHFVYHMVHCMIFHTLKNGSWVGMRLGSAIVYYFI